MKHLERLLNNCIAIMENCTNFTPVQTIADNNFIFQSKKPIPQTFGNEFHRGEIAEFTFGIDREADGIYVCFANSGDEIIAFTTKDFIEYINIFKP